MSGIEAALRPPLAPLRDPRNADGLPFLRPIVAMRGRNPSAVYEFTIPIPPPPREGARRSSSLERKQPKIPNRIRLARAYMESGADSLARVRIAEVLAENADDPSAHLLLLEMELRRATGALRNPNSTVPERVAALQAKREMEGRFIELAQRFADSRAVQLGVGDFFYKENRYEPSIVAYQRAFALDSTDLSVASRLGNLYLSTRNLPEAVAEFQRILRVTPTDAQAQGAVGGAYAAMGRLDDAISYLQTSVDLDSTDVEVRATLAQSYQAAGRRDMAVTQWQGILADPQADDLLKAQARQSLGLPPDPSLMP